LRLDISRIFPFDLTLGTHPLHTHLEYLNIVGAEQITPEQIDAFVVLLGAIKKSNVLVANEPPRRSKKG
jgi:hypothetical protein